MRSARVRAHTRTYFYVHPRAHSRPPPSTHTFACTQLRYDASVEKYSKNYEYAQREHIYAAGALMQKSAI